MPRNSNYSPAPWEALIGMWPKEPLIVDACDNHICTVTWFGSEREIVSEQSSQGYANAKLIVQAPAMYQLLQRIAQNGQAEEQDISRAVNILNKIKNNQK